MAREGTVEFDDGVLMGGVEVTSQLSLRARYL
jgi:hypothetical protein